jgi:hypothetical protein
MAISTFAALFLAHVIADYLLQTRWLVANKRHPRALGVHIGLVFAAMPLVTLGFSPWFMALAGLHLLIDLAKTFILRDGLPAYVADQALHIASIFLIASLAPGLWSQSPLAGIGWLPLFYLIVSVFLFAARGGQYAVATWIGRDPEVDTRGVHLGWAERVALSAVVALGASWLVPGVLAAKAGHVAVAWRARDAAGRRRLVKGTVLSLGWGLGCAAALSLLLPHMA